MDDNNSNIQQPAAPAEGAQQASQEPQFASKDDLASMRAQFAEQNQKLEQLMEHVIASRQPQRQEAPTKKMSELIFDDADEAARIIEERAVRRAEEQVTKRLTLSQATQQVVGEIASRYPEFGQTGSEAANLAVQRANSLPQHLKGTPEGARLVMLEVASELGLVPAGKRKQQVQQQQVDDFALGGNPAPSKRPSDPTKDIDAKTLAFAELLDPTILKDPKRLEGLKKSTNRKTWNRYE